MDQNNYTDVNQTANTVQKGGGKKRMMIIILVSVLVLALLGGACWYYADSQSESDDQKAKISELETKISVLENQSTDASVETEVGETEDTGEVAATCEGGSSYSAEVGKFDLTLSDPNITIRSLDGNFEGGPITNLSVGQCVEGLENVVDSAPGATVNITGHPAAVSGELKSAYEATLGSSLTADSNITIDGVTADVYTFSGLFDAKVIYFDNEGIGYEIELTDSNATTEAILTDIIADWDFTE